MKTQATSPKDLTPYLERKSYKSPPPQPEYLKDVEACNRYGVARSTWWRWLSEGVIPTPVKIGPRATRWRLSDLEAWEAQRGEVAQ